MLHVEFTTPLGARVTVDIEDPRQLDATLRQYGRLGWTSGEIPSGGYQFPYDNFHDFDWSLLGARKWKSPEGEDVIFHRGYSYKIRVLEAVDSRKMKLPPAIKISRGAKNTDPPHVREQAEGEFEYVTLAIFRNGKRRENLAVPAQEHAEAAD